MNKVKSLFKARWMSSLIFLLLLFLITGIAEPEFLSYSNIISCFNTATMYTLLAIGIAFVIMTGEIDVSIGSTLGLSAAMTGLIAKQDGSIAVMLLAVVATGAVIGLINGVGVAYFGVPSLIFTLGTNSVVRGMIYILSDGRTVENFGGSLASYGNLTLFAEITLYYALAILLVAVAHIVLTKTRRASTSSRSATTRAARTWSASPSRAPSFWPMCSAASLPVWAASCSPPSTARS